MKKLIVFISALFTFLFFIPQAFSAETTYWRTTYLGTMQKTSLTQQTKVEQNQKTMETTAVFEMLAPENRFQNIIPTEIHLIKRHTSFSNSQKKDHVVYELHLDTDHEFQRTLSFLEDYGIDDTPPIMPKVFTTNRSYYPDFSWNTEMETFLSSPVHADQKYYVFIEEKTQTIDGYGDYVDDTKTFSVNLKITRKEPYTNLFGQDKVEEITVFHENIHSYIIPQPEPPSRDLDYLFDE